MLYSNNLSASILSAACPDPIPIAIGTIGELHELTRIYCPQITRIIIKIGAGCGPKKIRGNKNP